MMSVFSVSGIRRLLQMIGPPNVRYLTDHLLRCFSSKGDNLDACAPDISVDGRYLSDLHIVIKALNF